MREFKNRSPLSVAKKVDYASELWSVGRAKNGFIQIADRLSKITAFRTASKLSQSVNGI
jgi:hypothetical protein